LDPPAIPGQWGVPPEEPILPSTCARPLLPACLQELKKIYKVGAKNQQKAMAKRQKGYNKCDGKSDKCTKKCRKKAKGNDTKFDKCARKCVAKKDSCRSKVDDRYPLM